MTEPTCVRADTTSSISSSSKDKEFKYFEFALSLLMKFCHNYDACRSEFGRVGGLGDSVGRILAEADSDADYERLVDLVCMACKASSNRVRMRDTAGQLVALVKLQQRLRSRRPASSSPNIDSSLHNRLMAALCCFVHCQDSMQSMFANGFVDSLLAYVDETVRAAMDEADETAKRDTSDDVDKKLDLMLSAVEGRKLSLRKLVDNGDVPVKPGPGSKKKRKSESMASLAAKARRMESPSPLQIDVPPLRHSSTSPSLDQLASTSPATMASSPVSPTSSCLLYSPPTLSMSSPPLPHLPRSTLSSSNFSPPFYVPQTSVCSPPTSYLGDEFASLSPPTFTLTATNRIQFSPSIVESSGDDDDDDDDQEICSISKRVLGLHTYDRFRSTESNRKKDQSTGGTLNGNFFSPVSFHGIFGSL